MNRTMNIGCREFAYTINIRYVIPCFSIMVLTFDFVLNLGLVFDPKRFEYDLFSPQAIPNALAWESHPQNRLRPWAMTEASPRAMTLSQLPRGEKAGSLSPCSEAYEAAARNQKPRSRNVHPPPPA
ncbi:hypothetical protein ED733_001700 [Metarhizium rileyi]|uniref:Uncharacterized protein n=1 Tax=Metarhizium rileyi (strain RCEF 4871) TaxID=1649241 RepID=A0A5C6G9Q1_METRR|nr:hypothetical protein ED733_001700 [Metarhizium rileyi]